MFLITRTRIYKERRDLSRLMDLMLHAKISDTGNETVIVTFGQACENPNEINKI